MGPLKVPSIAEKSRATSTRSRETVEAKREPIAFAARVHVEVEPVGMDPLRPDLGAHVFAPPRMSFPGSAPVASPFSKITSPEQIVAL